MIYHDSQPSHKDRRLPRCTHLPKVQSIAKDDIGVDQQNQKRA